ncbi:MAG: hypothetical protein Tsb0015_00690 [Simkaniaceae bacterium]
MSISNYFSMLPKDILFKIYLEMPVPNHILETCKGWKDLIHNNREALYPRLVKKYQMEHVISSSLARKITDPKNFLNTMQKLYDLVKDNTEEMEKSVRCFIPKEEMIFESNKLEMLEKVNNNKIVLSKFFDLLELAEPFSEKDLAFCSWHPHQLKKGYEMMSEYVLDVSETSLTALPDWVPEKMPDLETLDISHTLVAKLPDLAALKNLYHLDVSFTSISELPSNLNELTNLQFLNLSNTDIEVLPNLPGLKSLEQLDLSHTKIKKLPLWLKDLPKLNN